MENDTDLGQQIRDRREARGLSVRKAAQLAGISDGRWRQVEKGYQSVTRDVRVPARPGARTLRAMARVLEVDPLPWLHMAGFSEASTYDEESSIDQADVITAILADPYLLPEAKAHFLNQYHLLRRIGGPSVDAEVVAAVDADLHDVLAQQPDDGDELAEGRSKRRRKQV